MYKYISLGIAVTIVILIITVIVMITLKKDSTELSFVDARAIAAIPTSECSQQGTIGENGTYDENSKTWWIDFTPKPEFAQIGCNPACVVHSVTKQAEINWRCTGAILPATYDDLLLVDAPLAHTEITSPLTVTGKARGYWYFEGSFPIKLFDANNKLIAQASARAQSDWMTEEYVPFSVTFAFAAETETGTLVVQNDNPSGLPENEKEVQIPVHFVQGLRDVKLYYYNSKMDVDEQGNILCSRKGLVAVDRAIPRTITPIQDAIRLLLQGVITDEEKAQGLTTEYPLSGLALKGATLANSNLILEFTDPQNTTSGGSCRVGILWFQIEATAKQFPEVQAVQFIPEELFQP